MIGPWQELSKCEVRWYERVLADDQKNSKASATGSAGRLYANTMTGKSGIIILEPDLTRGQGWSQTQLPSLLSPPFQETLTHTNGTTRAEGLKSEFELGAAIGRAS